MAPNRIAPAALLVAAGFGTRYEVAKAEIYDPASGTWSATGSLTLRRSSHTATLLADGRVLVAGGVDASGESMESAEVYDPASGRWVNGGYMIDSRDWHTATLLTDGRVLVAGGYRRGGGILSSAELFDPAAGL